MGEEMTEEQRQKFLRGIEIAKRWAEEDAERWRHATDHERAVEVKGLLRMAAIIERSRGWDYPREPLTYPRLYSVRGR